MNNHGTTDVTLKRLVENLRAAIRAGKDGGQLQDEIQAVMTYLGENQGKTEEAITLLADLFAEDNYPAAALVAVMCGAFIESGANPDLIAPQLINAYREAAVQAKEFVVQCCVLGCIDDDLAAVVAAEPQDGGDETGQQDIVQASVEKYGPSVAAAHPVAAQAWESMGYFGMAGNAVLSRSAKARSLGARDEQFCALLRFLADIAPNAIYSYRLLGVLDNEEIVVLHKETSQGFRVRISGIEDNSQLHTLLGSIVNGPDGFPFPVPTEKEIAVARHLQDEDGVGFSGVFNMVNWTKFAANAAAEDEEGSLSQLSQSWIWNEGSPIDIIPFEGTRVIVVEEAPYKRQWGVGVMFPDLEPEITLIERLDPAEVQRWFERFAATPFDWEPEEE